MANFKFVLNRNGVKQLMQSDEMRDVCKSYADRAISRLGDGYESTVMVGKTRVNAQVEAVSFKARKENSDNNTILKAIRG